MDTLHASTELVEIDDKKITENSAETVISKEKLESLITPQQELSASIARKRRNLSKKQASKPRDQTPNRDTTLENTTDEETVDKRPKTPERRRRKLSKPLNTSVEKVDSIKLPETETNEANKLPTVNTNTTHIISRESIPKQSEPKKDNIVTITQTEVLALFNKAKRGLTSRRDKIKLRKGDKSNSNRSHSVPSQYLCENDLLEGLKRANLLDPNEQPRKLSYQDISSDSSEYLAKEDKTKPNRKPCRPIVQEYVKKRKQQRQASAKIIEILDPKTSKVIGKITKGNPELRVGFFSFVVIFRYLTIGDIYKTYKAFKIENKRECERIAKLRNRCFTDLVLIMIFCGLGGIMFKYIEGAFENFYKCGVKRVKRDFIDILWYRSHNLREDEWKSLARNKLRNFEEELHAAHEAGMHSYSGQRSWSFLNGIVYCLTVVTTIGYGHMYPTTITGMALTIVYAIIGIPLFLIALTDFGKLFTRGIKFIWSFVRRLYYTGSCRKVRNTARVDDILHGAQMVYHTLRRPSMFLTANNKNHEDDPENPKPSDGSATATTPTTPALSNFEIDDEFNLPISVAIFMLVLYIFLGAVMYCLLEGWDFFASFYFVFTSLSTIGFGDYVPRDPICMIASVFYLVFGLALMSMCINVVQVKLSDTFKDASSKLGATIGIDVNKDDGSITTVTPAPIEVPNIHVDDSENPFFKQNNNISKSSLKTKKEESADKEGENITPKVTKEVKF